jgi:hypothetical protein
MQSSWPSLKNEKSMIDYHTNEIEDFGSCCACGKHGPDVRNVICLNQLAPIPNTGWGCVVCGLPANGAVAVVCDHCLETKQKIQFACEGYVSEKGRIAVGKLQGMFYHRIHLHAKYERLEGKSN